MDFRVYMKLRVGNFWEYQQLNQMYITYLHRQFYFAVWIDITWMPMMQSTSSVGGRQMQEIFPPLSMR